MLPKHSRLSVKSFPEHPERSASSSYFTVRVARNNLPRNRFGVIVGKGVEKSAVGRNTLRRQAHEVARRVPGAGMDFLIIVRPSVSKLTHSAFREELEKKFKEIFRKLVSSHLA